MGMEKEEKERREKKSSKNHGDVIVTFYVESSTTAATHKPDQKPSSCKSNRRKRCFSKPSVSTGYGSDRKAQLLAYARRLRSSHCEEIGRLDTNLKKKRNSRKKFRVFFQRILNLMRSKEDCEPVLPDHERSDKKSEARRNRSNHFCKRLRSMLKELTRSWKCKDV